MMEVPWLLMRDLNVILRVEERSDFQDGDVLSSDENSFVSGIQELEVMNCASFGPTFTWSNKQVENFLAKKLDRVLVNEMFINRYLAAIFEVLEPKFSDHCAYRVEFDSPSRLK